MFPGLPLQLPRIPYKKTLKVPRAPPQRATFQNPLTTAPPADTTKIDAKTVAQESADISKHLQGNYKRWRGGGATVQAGDMAAVALRCLAIMSFPSLLSADVFRVAAMRAFFIAPTYVQAPSGHSETVQRETPARYRWAMAERDHPPAFQLMITIDWLIWTLTEFIENSATFVFECGAQLAVLDQNRVTLRQKAYRKFIMLLRTELWKWKGTKALYAWNPLRLNHWQYLQVCSDVTPHLSQIANLVNWKMLLRDFFSDYGNTVKATTYDFRDPRAIAYATSGGDSGGRGGKRGRGKRRRGRGRGRGGGSKRGRWSYADHQPSFDASHASGYWANSLASNWSAPAADMPLLSHQAPPQDAQWHF